MLNNQPNQVVKPHALTDTGIMWNGIKIMLLIPIDTGAPPSEIVAAYKRHIIEILNRLKQVTLKDIHETSLNIRKRIENGERLIAN